MKTLPSIFICLLLIAGFAAGGWLLSRKDRSAPEITRLERELEEARGKIAKLTDELAAERKAATARSLEKSTQAASTTAAPATAPTPAGAPGQPPDAKGPVAAKGGKGMMGAMRKMLDAPGMKEMMRQQSKVQIEMLYGKLFERFQLSPEEKEDFKELLAARQALQTDLGLKMMDENLTPEQRKQLTADHERAKQANDALIKTFLADDADYATFQHWEDTQPERMTFEMMGGRAQFATGGEPLSAEQEQQLIDTMAAVRKAPSALPDLSKPENFKAGNITDEQIAAQLKKTDADAQRVMQEAARFLSATQLEALRKWQASARSMTEAGLRMSNAMFQGEK